MFRGIDPAGLDALATTLDRQTSTLRHQTHITVDVLRRHGRSGDADRFGSTVGQIENWNLDTTGTLRWRAQTIRSGQGAGWDVFRVARARFAAEAVFSLDTVDETYRRWVESLLSSSQGVAEAVANISRWLHQGWTDWDITNQDLHNIWRTLRGLPDAEFDAVIASLSPRQLERWIAEMGNAINGFSRDEKRQLFSLLAANASGESLGRIHGAILGGGGSEEAIDLGTAIRDNADDQAIVDFVTHAANKGLAAHEYSALAPALAAGGIDDSTAIDTMVQVIVSNDETLRLVVVDSLVATATAGFGAAPTNPLGSLVNAITRGSDAQLKATVFAAIVAMATEADAQLRGLLQTRHGIVDDITTDLLGTRDVANRATEVLRSAESELLASATAILLSNTDGVVEQLATHVDAGGSATTDYFYTLVDRGYIEQLARFIDSLRSGDVVDLVAFSTAGPNPHYPYHHAQNLGFVAANLRKALEQYADSSKDDIDWIARGAGIATAGVGLVFTKVLDGVNVSGAGMEDITEWISPDYWAGKTKEEIDERLVQIIETIGTSLQPPSLLGMTTPNLGEALQAWDKRYDMVRGR